MPSICEEIDSQISLCYSSCSLSSTSSSFEYVGFFEFRHLSVSQCELGLHLLCHAFLYSHTSCGSILLWSSSYQPYCNGLLLLLRQYFFFFFDTRLRAGSTIAFVRSLASFDCSYRGSSSLVVVQSIVRPLIQIMLVIHLRDCFIHSIANQLSVLK